MKSTAHICCILPPHILHKLSEHPEHRQRALRALAITERLRGAAKCSLNSLLDYPPARNAAPSTTHNIKLIFLER